MAKRSKVVINERRKADGGPLRRVAGDAQGKVRTARSAEERGEAVRALNWLPRKASPVRVRNRDQVDGRPRGYVRKVGLSRVNRAPSPTGEVAGIANSS